MSRKEMSNRYTDAIPKLQSRVIEIAIGSRLLYRTR